MGSNKAEEAESDVGKVYCRQCDALFERSALGVGRSDINLKCTVGHSVSRIGSGWLHGLFGLACPWSLLHLSALVKTDYPVASMLLFVSLPVIGLIFLMTGLLAKNKQGLGTRNGYTLYWRENVGFGVGWLIGSALAAACYELNLVKF